MKSDNALTRNLNDQMSTLETIINEYEKYNGKIVRFININTRDIIAPSVDEEEENGKPSWLGEIGNSLHFTSRNWVVRNSLLFEEGDKFDAELIAESERILRQNGVFLDARIRVLPIKNKTDSIDILVITQDKWTISFLLSYDTNKKNGYLGLGDRNFLGFGHLLKAKFTHDQDKTIGTGGEFEYMATNIAGSFVNIDTKFETNRKRNFKEISFSRPFRTTYIPWSGAVSFSWLSDEFDYSTDNLGTNSYFYKEIIQDIWVGRTYKIWFLPEYLEKSTNAFTSARIKHTDHPNAPGNINISDQIFVSNTQLLFNAGILNLRFYKDNYINGFGVTEDIPIGGKISITTGQDIRPDMTRWYNGIEAIYSRRFDGVGYTSVDIKIGGFRNNYDWEQNIFNLNFIYHSELFKPADWKYRFFFQSDFLYGFNRLEGEQIYLNEENGIRGLTDFVLFGTKRVTLNLETRIFSPFKPLGFVLGGIIFSDFGMISSTRLHKSKVYQSYGIGLRTRNESIANADFVISLAYLPVNHGTTAGSYKILFTTSIVLGSRDFGISPPHIFEFNKND